MTLFRGMVSILPTHVWLARQIKRFNLMHWGPIRTSFLLLPETEKSANSGSLRITILPIAQRSVYRQVYTWCNITIQ